MYKLTVAHVDSHMVYVPVVSKGYQIPRFGFFAAYGFSKMVLVLCHSR